MKSLLTTLLILISTFGFAQMNNTQLEDILAIESDSIIGLQGRWQLTYKEVPMLVITDEKNDRMRIMTPVVETSKLTKEVLSLCLEANYHSVLDAKYAIADAVLWSVYIHPLSPLTKSQVQSALSQVYYASQTFGTTFTSTGLIFGGSTNGTTQKIPQKKI